MNPTGKYYEIMKDPSGFFRGDERRNIYYKALEYSKRDALLILLLWKTGRRIGEILLLKPEHINWEDGNILWYIEKKKKETRKWKPIDVRTLEALAYYVQDNNIPANQFIFQSNQKEGFPITRQRAFQLVRKYAEKSGVYFVGEKRPHPHHFRHSFAVDKAKKLKSPADMRKLQQYLEHSNIGVTEQYLQFGDTDLRTLIED